MNASLQRFFLLTTGLLFCVLGCTRDRAHLLMPDPLSHTTDIQASFEHDLQPILTARCALAGCHVAEGPHGLDFRTYASFIAGGEHGPAFVAGNAQESAVVEQIVSGRMPPVGPPLTAVEIQLFVEWIDRQAPQDPVSQHEPDAHGDADADAHEEADEHEEMDAAHDDEDGHAADDIDADHVN